MKSSSHLKSGRTIGERRERLETANERQAAHRRARRRRNLRIAVVSLGFALLMGVLILLAYLFFGTGTSRPTATSSSADLYEPSVEIVDEDLGTGDHITARMRNYIGQAEADFRDLGYKPVRAVLPAGSIREVRFYLSGYTGFVKLLIDRDSAVSVEDADRLIRYLEGKGITDFKYLDVRIAGKAYWQ